MNYDEFKKSISDIEREVVLFYEWAFEFYGWKNYGDILEVGTGWGIFARPALELSKATLTTIDKIPVLKTFDKNTAGFENRIKRIIGASDVELLKFKDGQFHLIFVDADHGYQGCLNDLANSWRVLADGGYLLVDDYFHTHNYDGEYGIQLAVKTFLKKTKQYATVFPAGNGYCLIQKR